MKIVHLSDLHLGKRINEYSLIEDQKYILNEILRIIDEEKPDCVILAGDIYDKSVPPSEAVVLFDDFIYRLSRRELQVFVISGNHDSPERLSCGSRIMDSSGIHISPVYDGKPAAHTLRDKYGEVNVYMLPFVKPANVRRFFEDEEIVSYTDAVRTAVNAFGADSSKRNVLVTHQFVTGALRSDSEELSVGGSDNVDASVFDAFDYVALGHIHRPQNVASERIRYCGTPLKYSFSESKDEKSVTVAELAEKGSLTVRTVPLVPLRDMREIKGRYEEITLRSFYEGTSYRDDYLHITLTDEEDIPEAVSRLRVIYRNIMKLDYDNTRTRHSAVIIGAGDTVNKTPAELFAEFYEAQNGCGMSEEQSAHIAGIIREIWEDRQ